MESFTDENGIATPIASDWWKLIFREESLSKSHIKLVSVITVFKIENNK